MEPVTETLVPLRALPVSAKPAIRRLDVGVGLLLPIGLLGLERGLFQDWSALGDWLPAAVAGTAGFVLALTGWLVVGRAASLLSGILAAAAGFALAVGVVLLPLSLVGLVVATPFGLLGLTPFAMAFVYFRCARDAWRSSRGFRALALFGFLFALLPPIGAQIATDRAVAHAFVLIEADEPSARHQGIELLRSLRLVHRPDDIASAYRSAETTERQERLAEAYLGVTGWDIALAD